MGKIIGIDLGTTNSVVSYMGENGAEIALSSQGERIMPSLVAFTKDNKILVGNPAKSQMVMNTNTVHSVKRLMGKRYSEVKPFLYQFNYEIVEDDDDRLKIKIDDVLYSAEEISAMIMMELKRAAENHIKDTIDGAILTVPAYFNDSQRQSTRDAGEIAGLKVKRIINEPTAASLSFSTKLKGEKKILVYDFGGGTIDVSILDIQNEVIKVLATAGDINIGGDDFDIMLTQEFIKEIMDKTGVDLSNDKVAIQRLRDEAEKGKKAVSSELSYEISLPFLAESDEGPINFQKDITREEFEKLIEKKVEDTINICERAIKAAGIATEDLDDILLVGGTTRIPLIQKKLKEFFKKEPGKKANPDEIVAMGAAIQGAITTGESRDILLIDVIAMSLGVKTHGGVFTKLVKANTTIPVSKNMVFSTAENDQAEVEIDVFQGESNKTENNKLLGKFILSGIKPSPAGEPRIEVSFNIDINGILLVSAIDLSTQNSKEIRVLHSGLLENTEIEDLKEKYSEVESFEEEMADIKILKEDIKLVAYYLEISGKNKDLGKDIRDECDLVRKKILIDIETDNPKKLQRLKKESLMFQEDIKVIIQEDAKQNKKEKTEEKKKKKDDTNPFLKVPKNLVD
ncbi:MAG: molecular chaperone DnaK [Candidatus Aminicenantes bacterium]|nr:molecular chaperone DnaK [Candidatus Aminicenantes bacterium]